jgi:hypothetical protein
MSKILTFEIPENEYKDLKAFLKDCSAEIRQSLDAKTKPIRLNVNLIAFDKILISSFY